MQVLGYGVFKRKLQFTRKFYVFDLNIIYLLAIIIGRMLPSKGNYLGGDLSHCASESERDTKQVIPRLDSIGGGVGCRGCTTGRGGCIAGWGGDGC